MVEAVCFYLYHGHFILAHVYIMLFLFSQGGTTHQYKDNSFSNNNNNVDTNALPSLSTAAVSPHSFASTVVQWNLHYCGYNRACEKYSPSVCYRCAPCKCDPICFTYGDCCPDVIFFKSRRHRTKDNRIIPTENQECLSAHVNLSQWPLADGSGEVDTNNRARRSVPKRFYMMSDCPVSSNQGVQECRQMEHMPPVTATGIGVASLVYKNIHCARCHGVKDALTWKVSVVCPEYNNSWPFSSHKAYPNVFVQRGCDVVYTPPGNTTPRQCYSEPNMISTCNETGQWLTHDDFLVRACASYLTPKIAEGMMYKNIFCYLCNKNHKSFDPELDKCRNDPFHDKTVFEGDLDYTQLGTSHDSQRVLQGTGHETCGDHGLYDPEQRKCRHVSCMFGQRLNSTTGHCQPAFIDVKGLTFDLYFKLKPRDSIPLSGEYDYIHHLPTDMEMALREKLPGRNVKIEDLTVSFNTSTEGGSCSDSSTSDVVLYVRIKCIERTNQSQLQETLLSLRQYSFSIAKYPWNITFETSPIKIPWYLMNPFGGYTTHTSRHCVKIVSTNLARIRQDGMMRVGTTTQDPVKEQARLTSPPVIQVSWLLTCPLVQLLPSEYNVQGGQLRVSWQRNSLSVDSYFMDRDGRVTVCLSTLLTKLSQNKQRRMSLEIMCSRVALPISIVLLLVCFIVHLVLRLPKSLPQKIYLVVIICLAMTQIAFWIGYFVPYYSDWCTAMGVIAHYFSLCLFVALTVSSYHLYKVFNTMHLSTDVSRENRTIGRYCCFIVASPIVIISLVIIIYKTMDRSHASIGYGSVALCFLTTPTAVWIALFIPLLVFIAISFVLYLLTYSTLKSNADLEINTTDERQVHFYFRSSLFVTLVWTLGAIAFQTALPEMRIAFIIAQCCLSLYIFITLVVNKRVAGLVLTGCSGTPSNKDNATTVFPLDNFNLEATTSNQSPVIFMAYRQKDGSKSIGGDSVSIDDLGDGELTSRYIGDGYSTIETLA